MQITVNKVSFLPLKSTIVCYAPIKTQARDNMLNLAVCLVGGWLDKVQYMIT
jgi:hypothetical protein